MVVYSLLIPPAVTWGIVLTLTVNCAQKVESSRHCGFARCRRGWEASVAIGARGVIKPPQSAV